MDLGLANGVDEDDENNGDEAAEEDEEDGIASFTLTKSAARRAHRDGPAADGLWDPLATMAVVPAAMPMTPKPKLRGSVGDAGTRRQSATTSSASRRPLAMMATSRSRDILAAEGEQEEEVLEAAWSRTSGVESDGQQLDVIGYARQRADVKGESRRGGRPRLGRRRHVVQVALVSEDEQGEVE